MCSGLWNKKGYVITEKDRELLINMVNEGRQMQIPLCRIANCMNSNVRTIKKIMSGNYIDRRKIVKNNLRKVIIPQMEKDKIYYLFNHPEVANMTVRQIYIYYTEKKNIEIKCALSSVYRVLEEYKRSKEKRRKIQKLCAKGLFKI